MDKMSLLQDLLADVKNLQYKGSYSRIKERGTMIAEKVFGNDSEYIKKNPSHSFFTFYLCYWP